MKKVNLFNLIFDIPILASSLIQVIDVCNKKTDQLLKTDTLTFNPEVILNQKNSQFILPIQIEDFNLPQNINNFEITNLKFKFNIIKYKSYFGNYKEYLEIKSNKISEIDLKKVNTIINQNKILNFKIKTEQKSSIFINTEAQFLGLNSTITKNSFNKFLLKDYEIKDLEIAIDYQHKEKLISQITFENQIWEFFQQNHNLSLTNVNNGYDVLKQTRDELQFYLRNIEEINWTIDLAYKNYEQILENKFEEWEFVIKVDDEIIKPKNNQKYFVLKLIDIELYPLLVKKIFLYFKKINWKINHNIKTEIDKGNKINTIDLNNIFVQILKENLFKNDDNEEIKKTVNKYFHLEKAKFQKINRLNIDIFIKKTNFYIGTLSITNFEIKNDNF